LHAVSEAIARGFGSDGLPWANMGQGAPETGPLEGAPARIHEFHFDCEQHEYAPLAGIPELREAVAALYNARYRRGMASQYSAANVMISPGGRMALTRWAAVLGSGAVGYFPPDYTAYEGLFEAVGASTPVPVIDPRLADPNASAQALEHAIFTQNLASALISNPNNPTGRVRSDTELEDWVAVARRTGTTLAWDEFYAHYVYDSPGPISAAAYVDDVDRDPVMIFDGLTKNWRYPGLRVSWIVAPKPIIDLMTRCSACLDGGCMWPVQNAVLPLLDPAIADQEAAVLRSFYAGKRDRMKERLVKLGVRPSRGARGSFYLWGDVSSLPRGWNTALDFLDRALDQQVVVIPGQAFDLNPEGSHAQGTGAYDNFVRFSYGPAEASLSAGFDRLDAALS
jgi:aspartate/methionine/tyrosine aminotransferase